MRRFLLSLAAAAIVSIASFSAPGTQAQAMTPGTAAGVLGALEDNRVAEEVRYVCRHRWRSSRRVCWWQGGRPYYRPYYRPYRAYRGYRRW
jgi:hypothetical protein